jgi:hypothetical protein
MKFASVCLAVAVLLAGGCNSPSARLNAPPHGKPDKAHELQSLYTHMTDNALLADMTVTDIHFIPHRAMLSPLGEDRLRRLASLMETYGGEIRFNTAVEDESLTARRLDVIVDFLMDAGIDTAVEVVAVGMPGGRGVAAEEAILIKRHQATYQPGAAGDGGKSGMSLE